MLLTPYQKCTYMSRGLRVEITETLNGTNQIPSPIRAFHITVTLSYHATYTPS